VTWLAAKVGTISSYQYGNIRARTSRRDSLWGNASNSNGNRAYLGSRARSDWLSPAGGRPRYAPCSARAAGGAASELAVRRLGPWLSTVTISGRFWSTYLAGCGRFIWPHLGVSRSDGGAAG
jgi:hypothetical protein